MFAYTVTDELTQLESVSCESYDSMYVLSFPRLRLLVKEIAWLVCLTREPCDIQKCNKKKYLLVNFIYQIIPQAHRAAKRWSAKSNKSRATFQNHLCVFHCKLQCPTV